MTSIRSTNENTWKGLILNRKPIKIIAMYLRKPPVAIDVNLKVPISLLELQIIYLIA